MKRLFAVLAILLCIGINSAFSQIPRFITYQGFLAKGGKSLANSPDSTLIMTFDIVDTNEMFLWQSGELKVMVVDGKFTVYLGKDQQFPVAI